MSSQLFLRAADGVFGNRLAALDVLSEYALCLLGGHLNVSNLFLAGLNYLDNGLIPTIILVPSRSLALEATWFFILSRMAESSAKLFI